MEIAIGLFILLYIYHAPKTMFMRPVRYLGRTRYPVIYFGCALIGSGHYIE